MLQRMRQGKEKKAGGQVCTLLTVRWYGVSDEGECVCVRQLDRLVSGCDSIDAMLACGVYAVRYTACRQCCCCCWTTSSHSRSTRITALLMYPRFAQVKNIHLTHVHKLLASPTSARREVSLIQSKSTSLSGATSPSIGPATPLRLDALLLQRFLRSSLVLLSQSNSAIERAHKNHTDQLAITDSCRLFCSVSIMSTQLITALTPNMTAAHVRKLNPAHRPILLVSDDSCSTGDRRMACRRVLCDCRLYV